MPLTNDHYKRVSNRRLSTREQRTVSIIVGLGLALVIVLVVSIAGGGALKQAKGCIATDFPSSLGIQDINKCGSAARDFCTSVGTPGGLSGLAGERVAASCRRAGYPIG